MNTKDGKFKLKGVKVILDGSIQGYTAYLSEPYYLSPSHES